MTDIKALLLEAAERLELVWRPGIGSMYPELAAELKAAAASMGEPVAYIYWWPDSERIKTLAFPDELPGDMDVITQPLGYLAPPPPAVPGAREFGDHHSEFDLGYSTGWNDCIRRTLENRQ